jgi:hypothetical protein
MEKNDREVLREVILEDIELLKLLATNRKYKKD